MKPGKPRRQPKREPKQRRKPAIRPEERDDEFETPDLSIPQPYQLPGLVQPSIHLCGETESSWRRLGRQAMAHAMTYPVGNRRLRNRMGEEPQSSLFRGQLWKSRIILRHSRDLAEKVLAGSLSLGKAFREARPPQLPAQEKTYGAASVKASRRDIAAPPKPTPSLPTLNSLRAPADKIDPAELNEFMQIFGGSE